MSKFKWCFFKNKLENLGIDPSTSCMLSRRSTIWANSPLWWFVGCKFTSDQHTTFSQKFLVSVKLQNYYSGKILETDVWNFYLCSECILLWLLSNDLMMGLCAVFLCCMWSQHIYKEIQTIFMKECLPCWILGSPAH